LAIVWVICSIETVHQRMIERNSPRDTFKLADWDKYVASQHFEVPDLAQRSTGILIP
jgi:hypothetical protein